MSWTQKDLCQIRNFIVVDGQFNNPNQLIELAYYDSTMRKVTSFLIKQRLSYMEQSMRVAKQNEFLFKYSHNLFKNFGTIHLNSPEFGMITQTIKNADLVLTKS